jgi:hypothetical protein
MFRVATRHGHPSTIGRWAGIAKERRDRSTRWRDRASRKVVISASSPARPQMSTLVSCASEHSASRHLQFGQDRLRRDATPDVRHRPGSRGAERCPSVPRRSTNDSWTPWPARAALQRSARPPRTVEHQIPDMSPHRSRAARRYLWAAPTLGPQFDLRQVRTVRLSVSLS